MKDTKKFPPTIFLTALALVLLLLSACSPQASQPIQETDDQSETADESSDTTDTSTEDDASSEEEASTEDMAEGDVRQLEGKITVAVQGAETLPGLPPTPRQEAWTQLLAEYAELQPGVTVELQDLPEGQSGEQWCETRRGANGLPDISMINECNYFRPSVEAVAAGEVIAVDFKDFEGETNPYTGQPWKDDWANELVRTGRCTEQGAFGMWTCFTQYYDGDTLLVNEDILAEYGYGPGEFPATITELWELSKTIDEDGKYKAWDDSDDRWRDYVFSMYTSLGMEEYQAGGGTLEDLHAGNVPNKDLRNAATQLCNSNWSIAESAALLEAWQQTANYIDAAGGSAFYFDPARDGSGQSWLTGQAAFRYGNVRDDLPVIEQAKRDGVFAVENWRLEGWPDLTTDDLINKDLEIYFDGARWLDIYGGGDVFAPIPGVRESGEDPNVDLIVRDFLQFLSSPTGQQAVVAEGRIPVNPVLLGEIGELADEVLSLKPEIFANSNQSPGGYARWSGWAVDPEKNMTAYLRGEVDLETAAQQADFATTQEVIKRLEDFIVSHEGVDGLPQVCVDWQTENS